MGIRLRQSIGFTALALLLAAPLSVAQTQGGGSGGSSGTASPAGAQPATPGAQPNSPPGAQPPTPTTEGASPPGAQPSSPPGAQPSSPPGAQPGTPPGTSQPAYPSTDPPRGLTPQQRQQQQAQGSAGAMQNTVQCSQESEAARAECLRRDMTDDEDRPAGVTRSMQNRERMQQRQDASVSSEANPATDRRRTRTATAPPTSQQQQSGGQSTSGSEDQAAPADESERTTEADTGTDTLGPDR